jgi:hypothetical protein
MSLMYLLYVMQLRFFLQDVSKKIGELTEDKVRSVQEALTTILTQSQIQSVVNNSTELVPAKPSVSDASLQDTIAGDTGGTCPLLTMDASLYALAPGGRITFPIPLEALAPSDMSSCSHSISRFDVSRQKVIDVMLLLWLHLAQHIFVFIMMETNIIVEYYHILTS